MASKPNEGDQEDLGSATALTIERRLFGLRNVFLILPSHTRPPFFPPIMGMVTQLLLACFVLLLFPFASFADFTGPVVSVLDGDTIEVLSMGSVLDFAPEYWAEAQSRPHQRGDPARFR